MSFEASAGTRYSIAVDAFSEDGLPANGWPFVVTVSRPPSNDDYAAAQDLGGSLPVGEVLGSVIGASAEPGEPEHAPASGNLASSSVWYRWTAPRGALVGVDVESNLMDSIVAVYTGSSPGGLTEVGSQDISVDGFKKRAVFQALAGTTYQIAVDGYSAENRDTETEDLFLISVHEVPANDDYADGTDLFDQALPISIAGSNLHANSEFARGEPDHAFSLGQNLASNSVWFFWTASAAGQVPVSLRDIEFDGVLAVYSVGAGGTLTDLNEVGAADVIGDGVAESLSFLAVAGQAYAIAVDVFSPDGGDAGGGTFTLNLGGDPVPGAYAQWIAGFPSLVGAEAEAEGNPSGDGISNLLKLVLGLDPTKGVAEDPRRANYPRLREFNGMPALEYVVEPANLGDGAGAIRHGGEVSTTGLVRWTDVGSLNIGGNTWVIEIQSVGSEARFGRLKVIDPSGN